MPELPDVAVFKNYIDATALHQPIRQVDVRDADVLEGISARRFQTMLTGRSLESTRQHGKHLFVQTDKPNLWLAVHFGMTGEPKYYKSPNDAPKYARVVWTFENGYHLAYDCLRKLGRLTFTEDPEAFIREKKLGPHALADNVDVQRFQEIVGGGRGTIKSALMNQEALAGIGNIYSDEILFHARVHPKRPVGKLDDKTLRTIYRQMHKVLPKAIECKVQPEKFPKSYLLPHRHPDEHCPRCGEPLKTLKVSGRTAWICENCQQ